jgi:nicotinamidase-related amidase
MLDAKKCCLVLVDVQERLIPVIQHPEIVVKNCAILIKLAKALDIPVLWCQQYPKALGPTVAELSGLLAGSQPVDKRTFSCCGIAEFTSKLKSLDADTAILCGIEAHVCVFQTAMDMLRLEMRVHIIADAVSSRSEQNKQLALNRMAANGVTINSIEMLLFELLKTSEHPKFKELSALIR